MRSVALPLGRAGTLREFGIWGSGPGIRAGAGTKGVTAGHAGTGVIMGITDMAERFGIDPIPVNIIKSIPGQLIRDVQK